MKYLVLALPLLLAACGTLPEPFYGDPGVEGARLAVPPPPVLVVPTPGAAMLDDASAALYARDLAGALVDNDVPSIARAAGKRDWRVVTTATLAGVSVTPHYAITGPDGKAYGAIDGAPAAAAAWANGDTNVLAQQAKTDANTLAKKLAQVNAAVQQSNPNSLENRPPRLFMASVNGAPGDGDSALQTAMTQDLPDADDELVTDPARADFTITGVVKSQPDANGQLLVELDWSVYDPGHRKIGQVTQLHDLAPADIIPYWGDVASAAAKEAAGGVQKVIENATLHKTPQPMT